MVEPEWREWGLGRYHPSSCGGHSYMHNPVELTDLKRLSEKAYRSTSLWQVVHHHPSEKQCKDSCEVYGSEVPQLVR